MMRVFGGFDRTAFAAYDDALHAGDGAFLLDQECPNVFTASVGNLRPGETVELQIRYVALLAREGRTELAEAAFRFLPTRARLDLAGWPDVDIFEH